MREKSDESVARDPPERHVVTTMQVCIGHQWVKQVIWTGRQPASLVILFSSAPALKSPAIICGTCGSDDENSQIPPANEQTAAETVCSRPEKVEQTSSFARATSEPLWSLFLGTTRCMPTRKNDHAAETQQHGKVGKLTG